MSKGCVLDLRLDDEQGTSAHDYSRYSNDGALTGCKWVENGMEFNGSSDYVDCGNDGSLDITDVITVSAWIYSNGIQLDSFAGIVLKALSYAMNFDNDGDGVYFTCTIGSVNKNAFIATLPQNQWVHLVGTYDGSIVQLYQDGVQTGTTTSTSGLLDVSANKIFVGSYGTTGAATDNYLKGSIAEVRIYNRALSAAEIYDEYESTKHRYK